MSEHILLDSILYRIEYHIISWVKPLYRQTRNGQWTGRAKLLLYINARTCWSSNRMFNEIEAKRERACSDTPVFPVKKLSGGCWRPDAEVAAHVLTRNRTLNTEHVSAVCWSKATITCGRKLTTRVCHSRLRISRVLSFFCVCISRVLLDPDSPSFSLWTSPRRSTGCIWYERAIAFFCSVQKKNCLLFGDLRNPTECFLCSQTPLRIWISLKQAFTGLYKI
jgi:hypothetical protein